MARFLKALIIFLFATMLFSGCVEEFEHDDPVKMSDFCDNDAEYARVVEDCLQSWREDPPGCAGVFSLRGTLRGIPINIIDTNVIRTEFTFKILRAPDVPDQDILARIAIIGTGPYFIYAINFQRLGADYLDFGAPIEYQVHNQKQDRLETYYDTIASIDFRIENGKESEEITIVNDIGSFFLEELNEEKAVGEFRIALGEESDLFEGCFTVFQTKIQREVLDFTQEEENAE
jgi:hypothetical protein